MIIKRISRKCITIKSVCVLQFSLSRSRKEVQVENIPFCWWKCVSNSTEMVRVSRVHFESFKIRVFSLAWYCLGWKSNKKCMLKIFFLLFASSSHFLCWTFNLFVLSSMILSLFFLNLYRWAPHFNLIYCDLNFSQTFFAKFNFNCAHSISNLVTKSLIVQKKNSLKFKWFWELQKFKFDSVKNILNKPVLVNYYLKSVENYNLKIDNKITISML